MSTQESGLGLASWRRIRQALLGVMGAAALAAGLIAGAAPAQADPGDHWNHDGNPYSPWEVCGSDYDIIDHTHLGGLGGNSAVAYLMESGAWDCVVTIKSYGVGTDGPTSAILTDGESDAGDNKYNPIDSGNYSYYAGPVYEIAAPEECVHWGGYSFGDTDRLPHNCG